MWLNDLFWGIRNTFVGKYHFLVINDHLWGPSVHVDKSIKKIQTGVRFPPPPSRQCLYFGKEWTGNPSLNASPLSSDRSISTGPSEWDVCLGVARGLLNRLCKRMIASKELKSCQNDSTLYSRVTVVLLAVDIVGDDIKRLVECQWCCGEDDHDQEKIMKSWWSWIP